MRTRNALAAGVVMVLLSACSKPTAEAPVRLDEEFAADLELAIFGGSSGADRGSAVISALELGQPDAPPGSRAAAPAPAGPVAAPRPAPQPEAARPTYMDGAEAVALIGEVEPVAAPEADASLPEGSDAPAGTGVEDDRPGDIAARGPGGKDRPGIIIRGGVTETDPCAIHIPRGGAGEILGPMGALINDRTPPGLGHPATSGRGRGGGFAGGFPGGIR